jgi:VCBS repeat-containing protein
MKIRPTFRRAAAALLLAGLVSVSASAADTGLLTSWTQDPATTRTFTWRNEDQAEEVLQIVSQADYDRDGFASPLEVAASCRDISLDDSGQWLYEVTATDLEPATTYVCRVGREGDWSDPVTFTTADDTAQTVTFAYMGDIQSAGDTAEDYAAWQLLTETMLERNPELSFAILGGDNVNSGISMTEFDLFRENASAVFSSVPLFSTVGNHESNFPSGKPELYLDQFAFPENGPEGFSEEFYSFDVANCHILVVNSWIFSGEQDLTEDDITRVNDWIAADLASSTADWQIVVTHVPVYAVHSDTTAAKVREDWEPIFQKYGVDLVFEGHQHVYSRSYPLSDGVIDYEQGIPYIMGAAGSKFYSSADETLAERTVYSTATYQLVQIDGKTLTVQSLDAEGNEVDFVTVSQRSVSTTRLDYLQTLWRAAGSPTASTAAPFTDTDDPAVAWAYENGYCYGYSAERFGPDDPITDWQIAQIAARMEASQ